MFTKENFLLIPTTNCHTAVRLYGKFRAIFNRELNIKGEKTIVKEVISYDYY